MLAFHRMKFDKTFVMMRVHYYLDYPLSYRDISEIMRERGIKVNASTIYRWVMKIVPQLEKAFKRYKRPVGLSWYLDKTYIKIDKAWWYLYRAVDKHNSTVEFLLTAKRDTKAAIRYLKKAINNNNEPTKINIDKSGSNKAAIEKYNDENF